MKRKLFCFITALIILINGLFLVGCDLLFGDFNNDSDSDNGQPQINNSVDLEEYSPSIDDDFQYEDDETYYTSVSIDLVTEINGNYTVDRPFTLDKENENKRIYHNLYLYEEDFFQVIYYKDITKLGSIYAILSDESDKEYAEIKLSSSGKPLQINVIKQGVYNIILDIETLAIDMVKVADIETPVYEKVKSCELKVHVSSSNFTYTEMELDTSTNEYYLQTEIPRNANIGFYNSSHTGNYKTTIETALMDTLVYWDFTNKGQIKVHVGGLYKVYFNAKTYKVRLELLNPNTANYFCQVEWQKDNILTPISNETPYLFEYEFVAQGKPNDPYVDIPSFYPQLGMKYSLSIINEDGKVAFDAYLTEDGTYKFTVNLKDYSLTIVKIS